MIASSFDAKTPQLNAVVSQVVGELYPDVQYIRFSIEDDWTGEPRLFFRVVLSDDVYPSGRLREVTGRVRNRLSELVIPELEALPPYFSFRGMSEQLALKTPEWEPFQ